MLSHLVVGVVGGGDGVVEGVDPKNNIFFERLADGGEVKEESIEVNVL